MSNTTEQAIIQSMLRAGIAREFTSPKVKLSQYGDMGRHLSQQAVSGSLSEQFEAGKGFFVHGNPKYAFAISQMLCRVAILDKLKTRVVSLPYLRDLLCERESPLSVTDDEMQAVLDCQVLGIMGFYDENFGGAFTERDLYKLGWYLQDRAMNGTALVLLSTSPLVEATWWPVHLLSALKDCTLSVEV